MVAQGSRIQRLLRSRGWRNRQFRGRSVLITVGLAALSLLLLTGCPPTIVKVPVSQENIIRANEAAREGDVAFARKDFYAALIKYLEASRNNPNSEYIFNKLGISYSQLKYYTEASAAFQRSIGLNPKYAFSYNNLGSVCFAMTDLKRAERYFKKAIGLNGNVASFHVNLGSLYFERRKAEKGMAELRKALTIDPQVMSRSEAINLAAGSNKGPSPEKNYSMARIYASLGDVDHAIDSLQQALAAGFTNIEAIRTEHDFDPIRQTEKFVAFMKSAGLLTSSP